MQPEVSTRSGGLPEERRERAPSGRLRLAVASLLLVVGALLPVVFVVAVGGATGGGGAVLVGVRLARILALQRAAPATRLRHGAPLLDPLQQEPEIRCSEGRYTLSGVLRLDDESSLAIDSQRVRMLRNVCVKIFFSQNFYYCCWLLQT